MKKWTERISDRNNGREENTPWWVNDKYKVHTFCQEHGLPIPGLLQVWKHPEEMELEGLPARFVLKPSVMFSDWGVLVLERIGADRFYDSLKQRELTLEQVRKEQLAAYERCQYKGQYKLLVEERVESPSESEAIPMDYKVSMFYDEPKLVQQVNRNVIPGEFSFFQGDFSPIDIDTAFDSDWSGKPLGQAFVPPNPNEILAIAKKAGTLIGSPFVRVDMYSSNKGPVIGEFTASPGDAFYGNNYSYSDAFDLELGQAWNDAIERIANDGKNLR